MPTERSPLLHSKLSPIIEQSATSFSTDGRSSPPAPSKRFETPDDALHMIGNPGRFHYIQFFALCLQFTPLLMSDLIPIFYNLPPQEIYCSHIVAANATGANFKPDIPHHIGYPGRNVTTDYCDCNGTLTFVYKDRQTSIIGDMQLVCSKKSLPDFTTTLYYVGSAVAGPLVGWISDHFGRRPVLLVASIVFVGIHVSLVFVRNFVLFTILRFLAGVGRVGMFSTAYVLLMEWSPPNRRTLVAAASEFFFPLGVMTLAVCSSFIQRWDLIQAFLAAFTCIALLNVWFAPESLQWLIVNGQINRAEETIRKIGYLNGHDVSENDVSGLAVIAQNTLREQETSHKYTVADCFRIPKIRKFTFLISFVWFATNFGYSGLSFLIDNFSDNIYTDLLVGGALELIPCLLATVVALRSGKRYPMTAFFVAAGVLAISGGLITASRLKVILALLARMSLVGSYCLMFLYAAELFPTQIRNSGFGVGFLFFMAGGMLSPSCPCLHATPSRDFLLLSLEEYRFWVPQR
ncbi:organic anion transporter 3-like [Paramacrobiotus metropolitanus]|uniref:organic anion transporter 3-like n=1 Tax=Paramacrobiotus metropolitanus TaxID=2943436 RepID=UPI002445C738|nr:organic anion transporter 3-like [Paramacrobiotus metropolitanus]